MKLSLKTLALTAILAASGLSSTAAAQKIAVVDMQRALNETEDGRKAKARLKKLFEKRQKSLDKQQTDLKNLKDSIEKQRSVLSPEVMRKKVEDLQKGMASLQQTYMEFQRELAAKEGELTKDIIARMQVIMRRVGQKEGFALVLERNEAGVVYIPSSYDLTDVLIQKYNAGEGGANKGKAKSKKKKKKK